MGNITVDNVNKTGMRNPMQKNKFNSKLENEEHNVEHQNANREWNTQNEILHT